MEHETNNPAHIFSTTEGKNVKNNLTSNPPRAWTLSELVGTEKSTEPPES